jgi:hypothetical protein
MAQVLRQRGWLSIVAELERQGYSQQQIAFMLGGVPQLQALTGNAPALPIGEQQNGHVTISSNPTNNTTAGQGGNSGGWGSILAELIESAPQDKQSAIKQLFKNLGFIQGEDTLSPLSESPNGR